MVNPDAARLSERITCELRDGEWHYLWSWGDPITTADDTGGAARAIGQVLALVRRCGYTVTWPDQGSR